MKRITVLCLLPVVLALAQDVTITWNQWPYGVRYVGSYTKWWMSADGSHVTVPAFNPDDTMWDLVAIGGSAVSHNAESDIRPTSEAQGSPPSYCTYAEKQIFNGQTSWGYENMDTTGGTQDMWLYGFYTQGTQIDYDPPYQQVYQFPMALGNSWAANWTWNYQGVDEVTETRNNYVVAQGKVRVESDSMRWYPCLVLREYSTTTDELGQYDDSRIIYEWVVPDMGNVGGSVATVQSQSYETDPGFTDAEHVFRQKQFHSVFDNQGPTFVNTTRIPSGYNLGPFFISSRITDVNGVRKDSIYYKIGGQSWQVAAHDSFRGSNFYFHIPQLSGTDTVRYYLAATDTAPARNRATDPDVGPAAPYWFWARDPAGDHTPPQISGTTLYNDTAFGGPFPVATSVYDSCSVDSVYLIYRFNAGADQYLTPDSARAGNYYFAIPAAAMNTFVRYKVKAIDGSPNRNTGFDPSSGYYSFNVVDAAGPSFDSTTQWPDTSYGGPFLVNSLITDASGVQTAKLLYKFGSANWDSVPLDSFSGSAYHFHIPHVPSAMSVKYYLEAFDNSIRHNVSTDPANAPTNYYTFYTEGLQGVGERTELVAGAACNLASINPRCVSLTMPSPAVLKLIVYDMKGARVAELSSGTKPAGTWQFALPAGLANGSYVLDIRLDDRRIVRSFVITK